MYFLPAGVMMPLTFEMAIANVITGCILCITIIGIPFGKQFFKFAKLSLMPFGAEIRDSFF